MFASKLVAFVALLGLSVAQYTMSPIYSSDYAPNYAGYSTVSNLKLPAGYSMTNVSLYTTYEAGNYDYVLAGVAFCYAKVVAGAYDQSTSACLDAPCSLGTNGGGADFSYFCPKKTTLSLAVGETVSDFQFFVNTQDICPVHMVITSSAGNSITVGSGFSANTAERTYNVPVPAGSQFAGFYTSNYYCPESIAFYYAGASVCGNGIVEQGEQCDGGSCCTATCTFAPSTTVCRGSAGLCDVAENCTGSSSACPADAFLPANTPCGEFFGMCDVLLEKSCTGTSAQCFPTPILPATSSQVQQWTDFNVLSFNTFTVNGGDVEGRLAVRNNAQLTSFTLGLKLDTLVDGYSPFSLFVAGNAAWSSGSLYPDGTNGNSQIASAYVGGVFTAPDYLQARRVNGSQAAVQTAFDAAQTYYTTVQTELAGLGINAVASLQYGDGLLITCNSASDDVYHLAVDAAIFNQVNWYSTEGCKFNARWIIDITGTGPVSFQGESFPGIVERVIYNVVGSGRTITANNAVAGHILAPRNTYTQTTGVTYGTVIVGDVLEARQNNKPNCVKFQSVSIAVKLLKAVTLGDSTIYVADLSNLILGDHICINSDCHVVTGGDYVYVNGQLTGAVTVDQAFAATAEANQFATVAVPAAAVRPDTPIAIRPSATSQQSAWGSSNGAVLCVSALLVVCLALLF